MDLTAARAAVARHARVTPLLPAVGLSETLGRPVYLKAECLQHTGSFKVRGAAARLEALSAEERTRGVVACSSGNHGRAVSFVAGRLGIPAVVYVPEWVDSVKLEGIRASGAEAVLAGETFDESEALAVQRARDDARVYVSAYDDPWVIAGQGTIADEILEQLDETPAAIVAPLSGGGLIGGMAVSLDARLDAAAPRCIAVSAEKAAVMLASVRAGRPVELAEEETLANALAGGIGLDNRHSFELIRDRIEDHVTVTEKEIADAMSYAVERCRLVVEGGGAVGLAALLGGVWTPGEDEPGAVVVVLSGGNVAADALVRVLARASDQPGEQLRQHRAGGAE
jgi:threonine dehydratase